MTSKNMPHTLPAYNRIMSDRLSILYTGRYYETAPRGRALREGLRSRGHLVHEVAIDHEVSRPWRWKLARQLENFRDPVDVVILADLGQVVASAVSKFCRRRGLPLVVDFFFPMYEAMVHDRGVLAPDSWRAARFQSQDLEALACGDAVFFDTLEHLLSTEAMYPGRCRQGHVIPIGCPEHFFEEVPPVPLEGSGPFNVLFWGSYIPLQGIEHILTAAAEISLCDPDIRFFLIGKSGQTYSEMRQRARNLGLSNVEFVPRIPQDQLRGHIKAADLALGIFGDTDKARRVVPHKVYEALALGVPTITMDTPACRHLLPPDACRLVSPERLAGEILRLKSDAPACRHLAESGARAARERFHPSVLGERLEKVLHAVVGSSRHAG